MIEIYSNIYIGTDADCSSMVSSGMAIIHACKYPCHAKILNYTKALLPTHPNYLILESGDHLFLNMVDMEQELLPRFANPIMKAAMSFIEKHIGNKKILIHCNQGVSRSPSIALLYLAKIGVVSNSNYSKAANNFRIKYPAFNPGSGIKLYLNRNWHLITH